MATRELSIPGFFDLQINGWGGVDFSSPTLSEDEVKTAFNEILASGTCMFLPTVITSSIETYRHVLPLIVKVAGLDEYKFSVPGLHLEGPFISPEDGARGCHLLENIAEASVATLDELIELSGGKLLLLTIAANISGASSVTKAAVQRGITVSLGHQMADRDHLANLAEAGATMMTHLGNGIPNSVHRHNNPLIAGLANDHLKGCFITDGFHLPPDVIKVALRSKGIDHSAIVSDAASLAGLQPGVVTWMGKEISIEQEAHGLVIRDPKNNCLAGSAATMLQCVNYLHSLSILTDPIHDLEKLAFYNPLKFVGLSCPKEFEGSTRLSYNDSEGFGILDPS